MLAYPGWRVASLRSATLTLGFDIEPRWGSLHPPTEERHLLRPRVIDFCHGLLDDPKNSPAPIAADNEQIDADLAGEYSHTHEEG